MAAADDGPLPDLSFDALMIADGGKRLQALAATLPVHGIEPARVRILGTGAWDEPGIGSEPSLVGGWYAAPRPTRGPISSANTAPPSRPSRTGWPLSRTTPPRWPSSSASALATDPSAGIC